MSSPIIDCDVHCAIPGHASLLPYLPDHWAEFVTTFGVRLPAVGMTYPAWTQMLATPSHEDAFDDLVADLDQRSVDLAILNCYHGVESFTHPFLGPAIATAVNSYLVEHWLDKDPRLLGTAAITPQHPDAAVREIERISRDERFVQVAVPARSEHGYGDRRYWPIWHAASEAGLAVAITTGAGTGMTPTPVGWPVSWFEDHAMAVVNFQSQIGSLVSCGIFDEREDLRIVLLESGWTWLPAYMWRLETEARAFHREVAWLRRPIKDYLQQHFRLTTQPADAPPDVEHLRQLVGYLGDDMLLYGSDYPHRYKTGIAELAAVLAQPQLDRVMGANAVAFYGLESRLVSNAV